MTRRRFRTPALDAWLAEVRCGGRTRTTFDPLFRAACEEANAILYPGIAPRLHGRCAADH